jgi:hypothetical protein
MNSIDRALDGICIGIAAHLEGESFDDRNRLATDLACRGQHRVAALREIISVPRGNKMAWQLAEAVYPELRSTAELRHLIAKRKQTNRILRNLTRASREQRQRQRWAQRSLHRATRS